jgi:hypothetical protein
VAEVDWRAKLDAHLRARLAAAPDRTADEPDEEVGVLVLVTGTLDDLASIGLAGAARAGNVLIARVPIDTIARIAQHPAISFIELARPLGYDE